MFCIFTKSPLIGLSASCPKVTCLKIHSFLMLPSFPVCLMYCSISWDSLPNKLLALESMFQSHFLGKPKSRHPPLTLCLHLVTTYSFTPSLLRFLKNNHIMKKLHFTTSTENPKWLKQIQGYLFLMEQ